MWLDGSGYDNNTRIVRGGEIETSGSQLPVSFRGLVLSEEEYSNNGFRIALYIK